MSMIKAIKRAFGLEEPEFTEFDDIEKTQENEEISGSELESRSVPTELEDFLDAVCGIINSGVSPMVIAAVDPVKQRQKVYDSLGAALDRLSETIRQESLKSLTGDRQKMQTELEELRNEQKDFNEKRNEQKANLLSEQRQRRALQERNRDLEQKIAELDSEIEQHKLSISSLMNKIRVSEVNDGEIEALKSSYEARINALTAKLEAQEAENVELASKIADLEAPQALAEALEQRKELVSPDEPEVKVEETQKKKRRGRKARPIVDDGPEPEPSEDLANIDIVDWLLPGGVPANHQSAPASDPDFGYQPPKHTPAPDPDAQLTLF